MSTMFGWCLDGRHQLCRGTAGVVSQTPSTAPLRPSQDSSGLSVHTCSCVCHKGTERLER